MKDPLWSRSTYSRFKEPRQPLVCPHLRTEPADGSGRWDLGPGGLPLPDPSCIPEFFGDTMLVNGTTFPEATVQARRYRLRLLNACNARFLNLQLYVDDGSTERDHPGCERQPDQYAIHLDETPRPMEGKSILAADRHRGRLPGEAGAGPV